MQLLLLDKLLRHALCISRLQAISQLLWHLFSIKLWTKVAVIIIYRGPRPDLDLHTWPPEGRLTKSELGFKFINLLIPDAQVNDDAVNIVTDAWHCLSKNCHYDVYLFSSSIQFSCWGLNQISSSLHIGQLTKITGPRLLVGCSVSGLRFSGLFLQSPVFQIAHE